MSAPNAARLERYLGREQIDGLISQMDGWYGPEIQLALPGTNDVRIHKDGGFSGKLTDGFFASMQDLLVERVNRFKRTSREWSERQRAWNKPLVAHAGFSSVADLIAENVGAGKRRHYHFLKAGTAGATGTAESLWRAGTWPAAAGAPSNAPGGDALTDASAGALNFGYDISASGDTEHFYQAKLNGASGNNFALMLYDRLFQVNKTMNSTATEAVTGVPTRYQSTTTTDQDFIGGNFLFNEVQTVLPATAHNWTVCQYTNQAGTTAQSVPSFAGVSAQVVNAFDMAIGRWFAPLAAGDYGIKALTQMQCDASVATGAIAFVIGHPIAWIPCLLSTYLHIVGELNFGFNFCRIFDNACLALLEPPKSANTGMTWTGYIATIRG